MLPYYFTHIRDPASSFLLSYVLAAMDLQLRSGSLLFSLIHLKTMACLLTCSIRLTSGHASPPFSHLSHLGTSFMKWLHEMHSLYRWAEKSPSLVLQRCHLKHCLLTAWPRRRPSYWAYQALSGPYSTSAMRAVVPASFTISR